jgi:sugar phosphate isomerase/epimerase
MIFGDAYYTAMDRGYYMPAALPQEIPLEGEVPEMGLNPRDIGISAPPMQDQLRALEAKIRQGATRVELGFTGKGKGSMGQGATTPEMYGKEERTDIKELATFNKVQLSTHASVAVGGLAGLSEGGFRDEAREAALNEIKRAIDFAADTTKGGAVVVHTGEFPRAISEAYPEFAAYPEEPEKAVMHLVDDRTGRIIESVRKNIPLVLPEWERDPKTGEFVYLDKEHKIRKPIYDPETGHFKAKEYPWSFFVEEAKRMNAQEGKEVTPEEAYFRSSFAAREEQAKSWALLYSREYQNMLNAKEKLEKVLKVYERIEKEVPPEQRWKLEMETRERYAEELAPLVPTDRKLTSELIKEKLWEINKRIESQRDFATSQEQQAKEFEVIKTHAVPIKDYAIEKSTDSLAKAALFAMQKTQAKNLPEPLFIAPESLWAQQYGSHPQELKKLVLESREKMAEMLKKRGYEDEKARQLANQHIKATFDIGHAYTWRKYFKEDPNKTWEENTKAFNEWLFKHVDDLAKSGVIGHIHISDNFGFEDEHVTPGQGIIPIKEFVEKVKKAGIKNVIVEPAHQDYKAMLGGWKTFGSSIYGLTTAGRRESWLDIEHSYFGRPAPPYFLYGPAAPDPEHWVLWTGIQLE